MTDPALDADLARAARAATLLVAMDFDGTLSELVDVPAEARPVDGALDALLSLAGLPGTSVVLISGRAIADLVRVSGAPDTFELIGSHGAERGRDADSAADGPRLAALDAAAAELAALSARVPGSSIERKPAAVVLHYRMVADPDVAFLLDAAARLAARYPQLVVAHGKRVVELSAHSADKGQALLALRGELAAEVVVFAGDDVTDEHVFAVLDPGDVGIKVGPGPSQARHRLSGPAAVAAVLAELAALRAARR